MADGYVGRVQRRCAVLAGVALSLALAAPVWGAGALEDADAQKAAVKCQTLIAKTTAKALATKLKAFNACAAAALACVATKADKADCPPKAAATCSKKLGSAAAAAAKARDKITATKSCLALSNEELLGADGLGFGGIAGTCAADFGIDVCDGLAPIAACLLTSHDVAAGALFGRPAPRTAELLGLLPGAPFAAATGLPTHPGCGNCTPPADARKGVEKCGKALGAGTQALASALEGAFGTCTLEHYGCAQAKAGAATCVTAATAACTKAAAKVTKAVAKLGAVAAKGCGVDFAAASATSGLNLNALASRCAALGVTPLDGPNALSTCLTAEARCAIATLVGTAVPRTAELTPADLGTLAADLGATCPTITALQTARAATAPRAVFGSILKLLKSVRRSVPSALGVRASGGKPASTGNNGSGVSKVTGSTKVKFGTIGKYKVSYHGPRGRIGGGLANDEPPPTLIVTVSRPDIVLDDHFELPLLTTPGDGSDVEDEIDVEFGDTIPACAFELSFATQSAAGVSDYASILQVLDEQDPVLPGVELVSRGPAGVQQDGAADGTSVAISPNGRWVAFTSLATNLVAPVAGHTASDVFLRDRCVADGVAIAGCTPTTTLESVNPGGELFHDGAAGHVAVSDDGRWVAYDVLRGPAPFVTQTFVKDRCLSNGEPVDVCLVGNLDASFDGESMTSGGVLSSMSSDGRYVAFTSNTTFGPGGPFMVYVLDRCVSTTAAVDGGCEPDLARISDSNAGGESNDDNAFGAVSRTGRFVAWRSNASDILNVGDTNGTNDVYLRDRCLDANGIPIDPCSQLTVRVNLDPNGNQSQGDDRATPPLTNVAVSENGRFVAFTSTATDLLPPGADTNGKRDVFVYDRCHDGFNAVPDCTPGAERVNLGPNGSESNGDIPGGFAISMSSNGRLIAFASDATNLQGPAVGTPSGTFQIFLRDRCRDDGVAIPGCTPATTLVSAAPDRGLGIANSDHPALAEGGSTTAFLSAASNLLGPGVDANGLRDVFAKDR